MPSLTDAATPQDIEALLHQRELARRNLLDFVTLTKENYDVGWIHREVCEIMDAFLQACREKRSPRFILSLPPGSGKSEIVSRRFPAFALGKHPDIEWVTVTYGQDLASDFGRDVRRIIEEPSYQAIFPDLLPRKDANSIDRFDTTQGGKYTAVGVGGALTGRRATVMSIDDPIKGREEADSELTRKKLIEWYMSVARTRLYPGAGLMVTLTRWHESDLAGFLVDAAANNEEADQWMVYNYPAIATEDEPHRRKGEALHPSRYPLKELTTLRASYAAADNMREWYSLYQGNPRPTEGIIFKREWIKYKQPDTGSGRSTRKYVTTDFAIGEKSTNDRTVLWPFEVDENDNIFFGVPTRERLNALDIVEKLIGHMKGATQAAIENVHISKTLGPLLRKRMQETNTYCPLWEFTANRDKQARASSLAGRMQQGKVYFHPNTKDIIEEEFIAFPAAKHDDAVDAASVGALMLDTIMSGQGPRSEPKPGPPAWSMEWMKQQLKASNKHDNDKGSIPTLTGKPRPRKPAPGDESAGGQRRGVVIHRP